MLLVLDLKLMKLRNFRKEIPIADDNQYLRCLQEDVISCEVRKMTIVYLSGDFRHFVCTVSQ